MKKGAVDVNEWDSGPTKFNGQWVQFVMTDDDLSSITIKATVVADENTTWEYHPVDPDSDVNEYVVLNFLGAPNTVTTTVAAEEINAQIEPEEETKPVDEDKPAAVDTGDKKGGTTDSKKTTAKKSVAKAKVTGLSAKTYTGKALKPAVTVKLGSIKLKKGTDYTVSYKNNKAVGKATVTIKGKGKYTGTLTKTFKINPKKTKVNKVTSPKTKQLKVTYKKVKGVTGYQVTFSTSKKFTKKTTKTVTAKRASKTSKLIKSLKKGKTYYVKVRTYKTVKGTKYYSNYTAVKKLKIK
ncbi:MAG: hypothetical protein IJ696_05745 [Ruminococcus sp.]|nr:hypothetical protein [Ruminococcus sp.]